MTGWTMLNEIAEVNNLAGSITCFMLQANTQFWLLDYPTALKIHLHVQKNFPYDFRFFHFIDLEHLFLDIN
jgi:hypothetical protein